MDIWLWVMPLALAGTIVWLSHQPRLPMDLSLPWGLDKLAHGLIYGILAWLLDLAWIRQSKRWPMYRRQIWILSFIAFFGLSDEWHQSFIPGRQASLWDWAADFLGGSFGLLIPLLSPLRARRPTCLSWIRGSSQRPDPTRPLMLVPDAHFQGNRGEKEVQSGLDLLRSLHERHPEADWLFLGDVFDLWVGLPGMEGPIHQDFLAWVQVRRSEGAWVGFWMGNREYFLDRHASCFDLMGEGTGGCLESEGLAFEHGDWINQADLSYRFWSLMTRSAFAWLFFLLLPSSWKRSLAQNLEQRLRASNQGARRRFPQEDWEQAARESSPAFYLTGHFHEERHFPEGCSLPWAHEGEIRFWQHGRIESSLVVNL